jgi:threonine dehydratase
LVPQGNSTKKNAAMRSFGAELIEYGRGFDDAKEQAGSLPSETSNMLLHSTAISSLALRLRF